MSEDGQVLGTYLHGLLDRPEALATILAWAGLTAEAATGWDMQAEQEKSLDRLADGVEAALQPGFMEALLAGF